MLEKICAGVAVAGILVLSGPAIAQETPQPATMRLVGEAEVAIAPDIAEVRIGVVTEAEDARSAVSDNSEAVSALIEVLRGLDIERRDMQTSDFAVEPRYHYPERPQRGDAPRIVGYQVRNSLFVRVRDLERLGEILDTAVRTGSNRIDGVAFNSSKRKEALLDARREAIGLAREKAEIFAEAAGVALGSIMTISEIGEPRPIPYAVRTQMVREEAAAVPIEAGELTIRASIEIVWEIEPDTP